MKAETVIKVLTRYAKSLQVMENEATSQEEPKDAEHYRFDKNVFREAIKLIETRKE